ncbi:YlcI/YnfO family protein [Sphingomonas sp.]|uniref:YlcI/YnfO family protein n=1 Tax=Sphingomonas sp. TaxID=28214 RepID=UPI0031D1513F
MSGSTEKKITVSQVRMGRPPIGKFTAVRLPPEMLDRIDAITGPGKRAAFIRDAVEAELDRREKKR